MDDYGDVCLECDLEISPYCEERECPWLDCWPETAAKTGWLHVGNSTKMVSEDGVIFRPETISGTI